MEQRPYYRSEETASNISNIEGVIKGGEGDDQNNDFAAKNTLEQNASTEIVENESEAEQQPVLGNEHGLSETLVQEQSSDIELIAPDILNKASSSLGILLAIPEAKLDKVLVKIAQSVFPNNASEPSVGNSSSLTFSSIDNIKPAIDTASIGQGLQDLTSAMTGPAKDFVSALKSGLAEFKQQAVQGREPGIDLKSIFSEALHKAAIANPAANIPVNQEQVLSNVTQILDVATGLSRALDSSSHSVAATYGALQREATQVQGEQTKQLQTTQLEQKFEKAVNISKPEGLQQLAEKVRWMANAKNLVAEIRLDPAELGSVHVKVAMSGESATVNFVVQSQHAREAMDQAAPRLREMLAEKGIELGQSSVRQESGQGNEREQELASEQGHKRDTNEDDEEQNLSTIEQPVINGALGGIDYFA
jgi:flagellar hook-length control protein FliK